MLRFVFWLASTQANLNRVHAIHIIFSREMARDQTVTSTAFHVDQVRINEWVGPNINFLK